jgi:type II secretory pathway component GspD/PulD (secretin)
MAPVQISTSKNYLKKITVTTSVSDGDESRDTDYDVDTLNYGFTMEILPRIFDHGRLIMLFNLSITDFLGFERVGSSDESKSTNDDSSSSGSSGDDSDDSESESEASTLQLPTMQMRGFVQEIAMRSGQTLVLSGFEELRETTVSSGIGKAKMGLLGGTAKNEAERKVLVIMVTPEVLQSPLSQEALMRDY